MTGNDFIILMFDKFFPLHKLKLTPTNDLHQSLETIQENSSTSDESLSSRMVAASILAASVSNVAGIATGHPLDTIKVSVPGY